ncbi:ABC transporter permease [Candidatus Gottesmanbacteria bacterium]|nr:ABC transporter permease [Candidatus Gottesmanbacteria bacterium]
MASTISFWQRIRRTPYQAVASVFMIFMTLFVLAVFFLLAGGLSSLLSYFETKPQLTVFFKDEKSKASVNELIGKLQTTGKVASYQYISKDQALAIYREQNKNDPLLLEMVTADILPSSLEISATSPQYLVELSDMAKKETAIDEVVFQKDVVDTLVSWTSTIRKIGLVFLVFLISSTIFILLTSVGMKIALKKEEIEILKLVGATSWYIRKPFIYEGVTYGIVGACLSFLVVSGIMLYLQPFITSFLKGIPALSLLHVFGINIIIWPPSLILFIILWAILTIAGFLIGLCGSSLAVSRYLKN